MHQVFLYVILTVTLKGVGVHICIYLAYIAWFLFARHLGYSDESSVIYSDEMKRYRDSKRLSNLVTR